MSDLKSFIVTEELRQGHAERYLDFVDKYHPEFVIDVKQNLQEFWDKTLTKVRKERLISADRIQLAQFKNPKATVELALINHAEKLTTPRSREPLEVTPSVKIPHVYDAEERQLIIRQLIEAANEAFKKTAEEWREILNFEKRGRITPWFKITSDHEEARLQLASSSEGEESYKTLYAVRLEHGKRSSKLKDFDRIYFVVLK